MNTAEIKLDVLDLIARCSHRLDGKDPKAYADLFTGDGTLTHRIDQTDMIQGQGKEELLEYVSRLCEERGDDQPRHHVRNTIFLTITENTVSTATYFLVTNVSGKGGFAVVTDTGIYEDEFALTSTGWRIKNRIAIYD